MSILSAALIWRCYRPFIQKPIRRVLNNFVRRMRKRSGFAQSPAKSVWQPEEYEVAEHEILLAFRALLASDSERFLPSAWQRFIQQLNYCSMNEIDELRWSLCTIAMNTAHLSFECVVLLAERLRWLQEENVGEIDEEELESFLYAIAKGNVF